MPLARLLTDDCRAKLVDAGLLWLRVLTGLAMAYHGSGKVFGDMSQLIAGVGAMGFPAPKLFAWLAALSEFGGGCLLVLGLATRPAALFIAATMGVAAFVAHRNDPFQVKELALAFLTNSIALLLAGPGRWSLDRVILKHGEKS